MAECPTCHTPLDLSAFPPGTIVSCPECNITFRVEESAPPPLFDANPYAAPQTQLRPRSRKKSDSQTILLAIKVLIGIGFVVYAAVLVNALSQAAYLQATGNKFTRELTPGLVMLGMSCPTFYFAAYIGVLGVAYFVVKDK